MNARKSMILRMKKNKIAQSKKEMKVKKEIIFTEKEATEIAECLETLNAMSGTINEHFTKECKRAGKYADKIRELI